MNNKRVIARIQGGIGNQLFSYAGAYALARDLGYLLYLDNLSYEIGYFRKNRLLEFNIAFDGIIKHPVSPKMHFKLQQICPPKGIYEKQPYVYQDILENAREYPYRDVYLSGYWQSERYFKKYRNELLYMFQSKDSAATQFIDSFFEKNHYRNTVAVHVRRGDFVTGGCALKPSFYFQAIEEMNSRVDDPEYIFFTDDKQFTKDFFNIENVSNYSMFEMETNDDIVELMCMAACKNQISSNSSYAWWGAWLKKNDNPQIIVPLMPYLSDTDYYPKHWKTIVAEKE